MTSKFPDRFGPDVTVTEVDLNDTEVYVGGERLTEERADRYADEFERRHANLVPGGKSLSGDGSTSPKVEFRVSRELRAALDARAAAEGVTATRIARRALEQFLNAS